MTIGDNWSRRPGYGSRNAQWRELPATDAQKAYLRRLGIDWAEPLTRGAANALISQQQIKRPQREQGG